MKNIALIAALSLALIGCQKQAESTTAAGVEFQVDKLFTVDGCTVYRFNDGGNPRYFTNCSGSTQWKESCGKNCSRPNGIQGGTKAMSYNRRASPHEQQPETRLASDAKIPEDERFIF